MQLDALTGPTPFAEGAAVVVAGDPKTAFTGIAYDSRKVEAGDLFVALIGGTTDGHRYLEEVAAKGAAAVLVDRDWYATHLPGLTIPILTAPNTRLALARASALFHGEPSRAFKLVGVTGTNGKTTTTHLVEAILREAGWPTGLVGTLGSRIATADGTQAQDTGHTTPQSLELQRLFARMRDLGVRGAAMEVSSHALDQDRVAVSHFDVGVFTNLTVDHLDYHGDMESYARAKQKLFAQLGAHGTAVVNRDDPAADRFLAAHPDGPNLTYSASGQEADLRAKGVVFSPTGSAWTLVAPSGEAPVALRLPGAFNVANALAAAGAAVALGIPLEQVARGLSRVGGVPGRVEVVSPPTCPFTVLVDYAHTPDGLENVLATARAFTRGRLIVVFGCGGDRDRSKRPQMGAIAARLADVAVLTSDNPRSEDPEAILAEVRAGMPPGAHQEFVDRREAIEAAVALAGPGDVVVIAGKGHEPYQILKDRTIAFDDREVAREALARQGAPC